jgi:hypothetical protein
LSKIKKKRARKLKKNKSYLIYESELVLMEVDGFVKLIVKVVEQEWEWMVVD